MKENLWWITDSTELREFDYFDMLYIGWAFQHFYGPMYAPQDIREHWSCVAEQLAGEMLEGLK